MLHTIKVVILLLATLAVMRGASWAAGWVLARVTRIGTARVAVAANAAALAAFAAFLAWNLMPGEPFDYAALVFGVAVYVACLLADLKWPPRWWHAGAAGGAR